MKKIARICLFTVWLAAGVKPVSGYGIPSDSTTIQTVSFAEQIVPVLRSRCAGCHMTGSEPGNLRLYPSAAYNSLVGVRSVSTGNLLVSAGRPDESYLLHKIKGTHLDAGGGGSRMPQGQEQLAQGVIEDIETWIRQGAIKN